MESRINLQREFGEFLERFHGDLWVTITFRRDVSQVTAEKRFKYFLKHLNTPSIRFYQKLLQLWIFYEKNPSGQGFHIHSLIKGIDPRMISLLENSFQTTFGNSKVLPRHEGVSDYLAKKYDTPSLEDFNFFTINSRLR